MYITSLIEHMYVVMYVAGHSSAYVSGLSVVCGCIHGCTLSILRDALVANAECTYIVMC